ncbi:MAG: DUF6496 domain-containing protein [Candidatus Korobacteraceae bacterium]
MPDEKTLERAQEDAREGKSPSTQAGEFVKEEMDHIREGKHGARSPQQAIAIGLSKARRAGVKLPPPKKGTTSEATRTKAERDERKGQSSTKEKTSAKRSRAVSGALKREGHSAASHSALSKQAKRTARQRGSAARKQAAKKAVRTKGAEGRRLAAQKATRTRQRRAA